MNQLPLARRVQILSALVEGCSLRSTSRMAGVSINTVTKLLVDVGEACARFQHESLRDLSCKRLQLDEIWSFCGMKQKNIPAERIGEYGIGDVWTWVAIDAETKLVPCWLVGLREPCYAQAFAQDLADRLSHRAQLTTDGLRMYLTAVDSAFGQEVDYAMLVKLYGNAGSNRNPETRYSPGECCGTQKTPITGNPDEQFVSTSYIERQNLTMRMRMRRFTRLTNAFSKKIDNLEHSVAIHFLHYNFVRTHQTLKTTPALKAGVANHQWTLEEMIGLTDRDSN